MPVTQVERVERLEVQVGQHLQSVHVHMWLSPVGSASKDWLVALQLSIRLLVFSAAASACGFSLLCHGSAMTMPSVCVRPYCA
jgi:hypothetical protein